MTDSDSSRAGTRRRHIVRLALFAAFLLGLFYLVAVTHVVDVEDVRRTVAATGPAAPLTYIVVAALLAAVFVPGPILAAGSGVLFGPVLGVSSRWARRSEPRSSPASSADAPGRTARAP